MYATADKGNISYYREIIENRVQEGDDIMCEVFEAIRQEGRQEGEMAGQAKQIVRMSMKYHATDDNILSELVTELNISKEQAEEYLKMFGK